MASGAFMRWGRRGPGKWVTVYAHGGHAYMVVAGLRLDTSMRDNPSRTGPAVVQAAAQEQPLPRAAPPRALGRGGAGGRPTRGPGWSILPFWGLLERD